MTNIWRNADTKQELFFDPVGQILQTLTQMDFMILRIRIDSCVSVGLRLVQYRLQGGARWFFRKIKNENRTKLRVRDVDGLGELECVVFALGNGEDTQKIGNQEEMSLIELELKSRAFQLEFDFPKRKSRNCFHELLPRLLIADQGDAIQSKRFFHWEELWEKLENRLCIT